MRFFFIKLALFSIFALFLNQLPYFIAGPYFGNRRYIKKHDFYSNNGDKFNTLFFGSSRLYRHINPGLLDELLEPYKTSTFNFAAPATYNPETYFLYEKFLSESEGNQIKYALVELQPLHPIADVNLAKVRSFYWINPRYLLFSIRYSIAANYSNSEKISLIGLYSQSYLNKIAFGSRRSLIKFLLKNRRFDKNVLGKERDGFLPIDEQLKEEKKGSGLHQRISALKNNPGEIQRRSDIAKAAFALNLDEKYINKIHLEKLLEMIESSEKRGIHLIFVILPRLTANYEELLLLKQVLPTQHVVELADPSKYPDLYQLEFSSDFVHVNTEGANRMTTYLGERLIEQVMKDP